MMPVRLYDNPQESAEMMMRHLTESLKLTVRQREEEPLLLDITGLSVIYLEIKNNLSKIVNKGLLAQNPQLTEERVKRLAYRNLRSEGWTPSRIISQSPFRDSCYLEVFMDNAFPPECQFLIPEMARNHMPDSCLIAYTNRKTTLLLRTNEKMETASDASRIAHKSRFKDVVKRSNRVMQHPVSDRIYWFHNGVARLLEEV